MNQKSISTADVNIPWELLVFVHLRPELDEESRDTQILEDVLFRIRYLNPIFDKISCILCFQTCICILDSSLRYDCVMMHSFNIASGGALAMFVKCCK